MGSLKLSDVGPWMYPWGGGAGEGVQREGKDERMVWVNKIDTAVRSKGI